MEGDKTFFSLIRELKIRNYSGRTVDSYLYYNKELLKFSQKEPRAISCEDIKRYLGYISETKSSSTVSVACNAIIFYYKIIWERPFVVHISRPKSNKYLPVVLSKQEIARMLENIKNKFDGLKTNPRRELGAHPLHGKLAKRWSCWLGSNIRMIYTINDTNKIIYIEAIGTHKIY